MFVIRLILAMLVVFVILTAVRMYFGSRRPK
jgi:hypothetical protein